MNPRVEALFNRPAWQRALMLLVLVGLIVGGCFYLLFLPNQEEMVQLNDRNSRLAAQLQQNRRIANDLPKFKAEYEKMKQRLDAALAELPNKKEIPSLLTSIAATAKDNGLEVLLFKPGGEAPKGFYAEVPVDLKLKGSYHQVGMFSQAIGDLPRIVNLNNLNLKGTKQEAGGMILDVGCKAITFRFLEKTAAKK